MDHAAGTRRIYGIDVTGMAAVREYVLSFWSAALTRYARAAQRTHESSARGTKGKTNGR